LRRRRNAKRRRRKAIHAALPYIFKMGRVIKNVGISMMVKSSRVKMGSRRLSYM
jgi:hypothetical protein